MNPLASREYKASLDSQPHVLTTCIENIILKHDIIHKRNSIGIIATMISTLFWNPKNPGLHVLGTRRLPPNNPRVGTRKKKTKKKNFQPSTQNSRIQLDVVQVYGVK